MLARGFIRLVPIGCGAPGVLGGIRLPDWDVVRGGPVAQARSIVVLHPTSYRESKVVGEHLRDGDVVLLDLTRLDTDDMHRLVDFVSGLVFGLQGNIDKVTAYGTDNGRIAVGLTLAAKPASGSIGETKGQIWLTAKPVNAAGSPQVEFRDLQVTGDTNGVGGDLLIQLGNSPGISSQIAASLTQNFTTDLDDLLGKIRKAIGTVHEGDFVLRGQVDSYRIGQIHAYGNGLYLPVHMNGNARIAYRPTR